jgi:hypothetical protein
MVLESMLVLRARAGKYTSILTEIARVWAKSLCIDARGDVELWTRLGS